MKCRVFIRMWFFLTNEFLFRTKARRE